MKTIINTSVQNGKLNRNRKALQKAVEQEEGREIVITIERKKKKRSSLQNAYYWGCLINMVRIGIKDATGHNSSIDEVHNYLSGKFHTTEIVNKTTGEIDVMPKSTTEDTTVQFEEYQLECRAWAKEWLGIDIPLPNEQIEIEL